jgi:hypothetical protein
MAFRSSIKSLTIAIAIAVLGVSSLARAAPDGDDARARSEEALREGVRERLAGHEREALDQFQRAYELSPSARARAQMGLAAKSLRLYVEAETYLHDALAAESDAWIAENRATLEQALEVVDRQLAWLTMTTRPPEVDVAINGRRVGRAASGTKLRVGAGPLIVELRAPGFQTHTIHVEALARSSVVVDVTLERDATRFVAGVAKPSADAHPPAGVPLRSILLFSSAGLAAVGIGAGAYFGLRAADLKDDRDRVCPKERCTTGAGVELDRDGRTAGTWATVSFAVAAAAVGLAVYLLVTEPRRTTAHAAALSW